MKKFNDNSNAQYLTNNGETILSQDLINACRISAEVLFHQNRKSVRTLDLEDFFQNIYLKAQMGIAGFDSHKASLKTWVSRIAWNSLMDFLDREKRRTSLFRPLTAIDEDGDEYVAPKIAGYRGDEYEADRELITSEDFSAIEAACGKLCDSHRLVLDLMEKGYKPREIAKITGWPSTKVYGALCWGRKNLSKSLGKDFLRENGIAA